MPGLAGEPYLAQSPKYGGVPERFKGAVLKTVVVQATVGSNPTPSAMF
jgi:hypothetical protein